jgi:D-glycero-D-manno-heptose 1,7-bisphosphate phosphatase
MNGYNFLFLDRDGVINRHRPGDYVKTWDEFEFLPGTLQALAGLSTRFRFIFIVTNQRGVSKGLMSEAMLKSIHERMLVEINKSGGRIDKIYYCTASSKEDINRKPNPGMALQAKRDFPEIEFTRSVMVGDSDSDIEFGKRLGMKTLRAGAAGLAEMIDQLILMIKSA